MAIRRRKLSMIAALVAAVALMLVTATAGDAHSVFWRTNYSSFGGCGFAMQYGHQLAAGNNPADARTISDGSSSNPCLDQVGVRLYYHHHDNWVVYVTPWKYSTTNWVRVYRTLYHRYHGSRHFVAKSGQTAVVSRP